ncbi:MAG: Cof-type HAD-IIB family hydrolase [Clostridium sp.]
MRKLLASDLDGTLVKENNITDENKSAVIRLNKSGNKFAVSTGRPYNGVEFLEDEHNIKIDYYILLNGALILNKDKTPIKHEKINRETIGEIIKSIENENIAVSVESGYVTYVLDGDVNLCYPNQVKVNSLDEIKDELSLISIFFKDEEIERIEEIKNLINSRFSTEVISYRNSSFIDVVPVGCSKGHGVKHVAKSLDIKDEGIFTIGDSWNDVTMFDVTKNSFTFHDVEEELKKHATYIVDSVSECIGYIS